MCRNIFNDHSAFETRANPNRKLSNSITLKSVKKTHMVGKLFALDGPDKGGRPIWKAGISYPVNTRQGR